MNLQTRDNIWDGVATTFKPCLKPHIKVRRHHRRTIVSYVLEDTLTSQRYSFSNAAYSIVGRLTGNVTMEEIFNYLSKEKSTTEVTKDFFLSVIRQLVQLGAIAEPLPKELSTNSLTKKGLQTDILSQVKRSPLFLKIPLFSPSNILERYIRYVRPLYNRGLLAFLALLFVLALSQLIIVWPDLTSNALDRIFTRNNLFVLWLIYPVVKTIHEFAHAFTVKYFGGNVTEMGFMFLIFMPVPYVNASDSAGFTNKWQRIAVSASGIIAELTLASFALLLWSAVEPGLLRTIAFNTVLICGFSTLLFNGNPLVRFDGYYILSDLIEINNLAAKSGTHLWNIFLRFTAGIKKSSSAPISPSQTRLYVSYGIASFFYRLTIYSSIFYLFATRLGPVGAVIGILAVSQILILPLIKRLRQSLNSPTYQPKKKRIIFSILTVFTVLFCAICLLPLPHTITSEGVIWRADENQVKMQSPGFIMKPEINSGDYVEKGQLLFTGEDTQLTHNIMMLQSQVTELRLKEKAAFANDPFESKIIREKLVELQEKLHDKEQQQHDLRILSPLSGLFFSNTQGALTGIFFKQGESLGFIQSKAKMIRTLIPQKDIDPILEKNTNIEIRVFSDPETIFKGEIISANPQSTFRLPSKVLGTNGGGKILLNPEDKAQITTLEEMFQLDIELETSPKHSFPESRVFIKFHLGYQPLLLRWIRSARQLFLNEFRG